MSATPPSATPPSASPSPIERPGPGWRLLARLAASLLRVLGATWRLRLEGEDPFAQGRPFVGVLWHQGMVVAAYCWRDRGLAIPVSRSRDGGRVDALLQNLGFAPSPRGSSSRGGAALLRQLVRRVRAGESVGFLPDGPRGPARRTKPGPVALGRLSGAALVPVGVAARPRWTFGSWDRSILPLPFARVRCRYGPPLCVPKQADAETLEQFRLRLEAALEQVQARVEEELGLPPTSRDVLPCGS